MFDEGFIGTIKEGLRQEQRARTNKQSKDKQPNPPGVQDSDPMWLEFASSKMLPTDQLLHDEIDFRKFRNIVSHQYIEVRLHRSRSKEKRSDDRYRSSSREQLDALQKIRVVQFRFLKFRWAAWHRKVDPASHGLRPPTVPKFQRADEDEQDNIPKESREEKTNILYYLHSQTLARRSCPRNQVHPAAGLHARCSGSIPEEYTALLDELN